MAEQVTRVCDFRGAKHSGKACQTPVPNDEPTPITIGTTRYLIDLCDEHKKQLNEAVEPFIKVAFDAQKRMSTSVRKAFHAKSGGAFTAKDVREWLRSQGRSVPSTGRLPQDLIREYQEAHS